MMDKQTQCPKCASIYKVSVAQLTVAQGMVCCPKCSYSFNAFLHFVTITNPDLSSPPPTKISNHSPDTIKTSSDILEIFSQKVEHSNIDLETYLNNLNYFSTEPIVKIPSLNLAEEKALIKLKQPTARTTYYVTWGMITAILLFILSFQLIMLNPNFLSNHPAINKAFIKVCDLVNCSDLEKQYTYIDINNLKTYHQDQRNINLMGELTNKSSRSLQMPLLLLTLSQNGQVVFSRSYTSKEYLITGLKNINRIPVNSPFSFNIHLPLPSKNFDHYELQIIRP